MSKAVSASKKVDPLDKWRFSGLVFIALAISAVIYTILIFNYFHGTRSVSGNSGTNLFINLSVAIPEIAIWGIAAVGALNFKRYSTAVKKSEDGRAFDEIANALLLMVLYVVLLTSAHVVTYLFRDSIHLETAVTVGTHLPLLIVLVAAILLFRGSQKLSKITPSDILSGGRHSLFILLFGIFAAFFIWNFYRIEPSLAPQHGIPRFSLPADTLLFSYIIPHLVVWFLSFTACLNIGNYAVKTKGRIYRQLFMGLSRGIVLVFICTFLAQLLIISNTNLDGFSLALVMIYALLGLAVIGFVLIYRGANAMARIERA